MARLQIKREVLESTKERSILSAEELSAVDRVLGAEGKGQNKGAKIKGTFKVPG
jgi:hypothetical protein